MATNSIAIRFKAKAKELMPHQTSLQDLDDNINHTYLIDDIMFRKGEYIGGMAAVIIELIIRDAQ